MIKISLNILSHNSTIDLINKTDIYYLEVTKDNSLSVLLDSDIGYYHYFNKGDIITVEESKMYHEQSVYSASNGGIISNIKLKMGWLELINPELTVTESYSKHWQNRYSLRTICEECRSGSLNYIKDITTLVDRDKKLDMLGI